MASDDPWADVFAMADGRSSYVTVDNHATLSSLSLSQQHNGSSSGSTKRKRERERERERKRERKQKAYPFSISSREYDMYWQEHLNSRSRYTNISERLVTERKGAASSSSSNSGASVPLLFSLGKGLLEGPEQCQGWQSDMFMCKTCASCKRAIFRHSLSLNDSHEPSRVSFLNLYCILRNIRGLAVCCILDTKAQAFVTWKTQSNVLGQWFHGPFQRYHGSWALLESPMNELMQQLGRLSHQRHSASVKILDLVEMIILCDRCYYEIYYHDMTARSTHEFIPHPTAYFGEVYGSGELRQWLNDHQTTSKPLPSSLSSNIYYHWNPADDSDIDLESVDALTILQRIRLLETMVFFQQITNNKEWTKQERETLELDLRPGGHVWPLSPMNVHETPAPNILRKWRDCCRDYLTHVYGYATLPPTIIEEIVKFAMGSTILELGAGTGYLAHLLRAQGASVRALDVAPTSCLSSNEYHAETPAFTTVERGTVASLSQWKMLASPQSSNQKKKASQASRPNRTGDVATCPYTLLLAYPPPDSEMGYQAVEAFVNNNVGGSSRLVHIGEFHGLTGTRRLERFLAQHGTQLQPPLPCPTWGTDAASVTFWNLTQPQRQPQQPSSLQQPTESRWWTKLPLTRCEYCHTKPGYKRLRILRQLHFCSSDCWHKYRVDASSSLVLLQDHLICSSLSPHVDDVNVLDYDNPLHFYELPI